MLENKDLFFVLDFLSNKFIGLTTELNYSTPFQLLIAVILSAQTTDKQVNKVTNKFFDTILYPKDVLNLGLSDLESLISSINYYKSKAKNIYNTSVILSSNIKLLDTKNRTDLLVLPGVGEKTAKVIVHVLHQVPVVAVDTHVHRVSNRIGLVNTSTPLHTSKLLEKVIPDKYKGMFHHSMIYFGRYFCKAKNPKCIECPFTKLCLYYNQK